eukprot:3073-Pyramimonas_sp.AAC.1
MKCLKLAKLLIVSFNFEAVRAQQFAAHVHGVAAPCVGLQFSPMALIRLANSAQPLAWVKRGPSWQRSLPTKFLLQLPSSNVQRRHAPCPRHLRPARE